MAVLIELAVMTGLQQELRERILGSNPHIYISKVGGIADYHAEADRLRRFPHITGAAPAILGKALITASRNQDFITLKAVDPALEPSVSDIEGAMQKGSISALDPPPGSDALDGILLGKDLAASLGADVGDSVTLLSPEGSLSPMGVIP